MEDKDQIRNRVTTILGMVGILLGFLLNAAITINFSEFNPKNYSELYIKAFFLIAIIFTTMCILNGLSTYMETFPKKGIKDDPVKKSFQYLIYSITATILITIAVLSKSPIVSIISGIIIVFLLRKDGNIIKESKTSQPPTIIEKRLT